MTGRIGHVFGLAAMIVLFAFSPNLWAQPKPLTLSSAEAHALVRAYRAGDHYGIGFIFAAIVWEESTFCVRMHGDHGRAYGCSQIHESAAEAVSGVKIPPWMLDDRNLDDFNLALGARYLDLCLRRFGYPAGIGCYHVGIPEAGAMGKRALSRLPYTQLVLARIRRLHRIPVED